MLKISEKILQKSPPPPHFLYYFIQRRPEASQVAAMLKKFVHNFERKATKEKRAFNFSNILP